jgi:hypothetical protein
MNPPDPVLQVILMVSFCMRKKLLVWLYTRIELMLTQGFRLFRNLAFKAADHQTSSVFGNQKSTAVVSLGENVGVIITTFEQRFDVYAIPLIRSLRQAIMNPIFLVVNGNYGNPPSTMASRRLLASLSEFDQVYPIFLGQMFGCSTLWNTGLKHSGLDINFIFNDDISLNEETLALEMQRALIELSKSSILTINRSWSHFLITNRCISSVGAFDERFLGFGEEDGDYIRRLVDLTGKGPANIFLDGFVNIIDQSRDESVAVSWGKYSLFNKCLYFLKYPDSINDQIFEVSEICDIPSLDNDFGSIMQFREHFYPMLVCEDPQEIMNSVLRYYK